MKIRYFDHAATTPVDNEVLKEMMPFFSQNFGNPSSIYSIGKSNKHEVQIARNRVATALNVKPQEIYFTSCGSESDNLAIKGIAYGNRKKGNHIITTRIEHPAVLKTCEFLEKQGYHITYLSPNSNGIINVKELERYIMPNTILVSVMFANNEIGTIQEIKAIGELCRRKNVYFHTDCVQAVGNVRIDAKEMNIDSLSLSAHKFYGPKGVGAVYIREGINFVRIQDGGHQERDKRAGTENVAGIVGLGKAIELANNSLDEYNNHLTRLRDYYIENVQKRIPNIKINGDLEKRLPGNANISFIGADGEKVLEELDKIGICASSGSACSAGLLNPSHVLLAIGVAPNVASTSLRITFGKENTLEDVDYLVENLTNIIEKIRNEK